MFAVRETPDAFRKAVQVVHSKPTSPLSLLQRKLGNAWLKNAIERSADAEGWWELGIKDLAETIGFDSNNRQYLKESAEALMRIVHEWDVLASSNKRVQWKASVLFPEIEIRSDVIRYQISSQMRERMINPEIYALIDMKVVRRFRRAPSLAIWEFCVRFEKIERTTEVEWEMFRDMMLGESAEGKTYQEYKYFKSKVLNPAIAEINAESHHTIRLEESKVGKRVSRIRFVVARKVAADEHADAGLGDGVLAELGEFGVPMSEARRLLRQHDAATVKRAIDYTLRRKSDTKLAPLSNPAAYFRQTLSNNYAPITAETPKPARPRAPEKSIDIKASYLGAKVVEAEQYYGELDADDQRELIRRYNSQEQSATLRLNSKPSRTAQVSFYRWLVTDTWGEATTDELLAFAQGMLEGR